MAALLTTCAFDDIIEHCFDARGVHQAGQRVELSGRGAKRDEVRRDPLQSGPVIGLCRRSERLHFPLGGLLLVGELIVIQTLERKPIFVPLQEMMHVFLERWREGGPRTKREITLALLVFELVLWPTQEFHPRLGPGRRGLSDDPGALRAQVCLAQQVMELIEMHLPDLSRRPSLLGGDVREPAETNPGRVVPDPLLRDDFRDAVQQSLPLCRQRRDMAPRHHGQPSKPQSTP